MKPTGLRMYLHPSRKWTRISLEGDLAGGWVQELERCWRTLSGPGDSLYVDVRRLECTDRNGHRLLATMYRQGVTIAGFDPDSGLLRRRAKILPWLVRLWDVATHGYRLHVLHTSRLR